MASTKLIQIIKKRVTKFIRKNIRTFVKGMVWEFTGFIALLIITHSLEIGFLYTGLRVIMYFIHDKLWKLTSWGKYKRKNGRK